MTTRTNEYLEINGNGESVTYLSAAKPIKAPKPIAKPKSKKASGYIIYRGASLLDGKPIVVVAITKESKNSKTGNMVQTYIMADNGRSPVDSARLLEDVSVCGDCKHRRGMGGSCYVNLGQGARSVMDGVMRGIYFDGAGDPYPEDAALWAAMVASTGRKVRLGTYGDPAAVPAYVWEKLTFQASGWTGYTHQWASGKADHVKQWCMASADTIQEMKLAKADGWRTFRVRPADGKLEFGHELVCPASAEANKRLTCATCMACSGGIDSKKASVAIIVHGSLKNRFAASVAA
jgi:hypothetical protein